VRLIVLLQGIQHAQQRKANRHQYCQSNVIALGELSNKQRWNRIQNSQSIREIVNMVNPKNDRYHKLNLINLTRNATFCDATTKDPSISNVCL
jgi:hypothetical protein